MYVNGTISCSANKPELVRILNVFALDLIPLGQSEVDNIKFLLAVGSPEQKVLWFHVAV